MSGKEVSKGVRGKPCTLIRFSPQVCKRFIDKLEDTGNVIQAARLARLIPRTVREWLDRGRTEAEALNRIPEFTDEDVTPYIEFYLDAFEAMERRNVKIEEIIEEAARGKKSEGLLGSWQAAAWLLERKSEDNSYGQRSAQRPEQNVELVVKVEEVTGDAWRLGGRAQILISAKDEYIDTSFVGEEDGKG